MRFVTAAELTDPRPAGPRVVLMPEHLTPRHLVEALMQRISDQNWDGLDGFYADDAVIEYPFALPAPLRLEGRPAIARYFAAVARAPATGHLTRLAERMGASPPPPPAPI
ncbi:MAG TPA: nuclear transport factor 2 family protein [Streptosporangiaceae bacterium]|nr:nuclear transport factor 2 family protein [Streptosporangiaceae bacterium]